ncbi:MAG: hypothetical protein V4733_04005 [Verrucomicrobiota bacterium]
MKPICKTIAVLLPATFLTGQISADMAPQPKVAFTRAAPGTFAADWQGVAGRIYFMEWSLDLKTWFYAPFIAFGDGMHSRGLASSTDKGFFRLRYEDDPEITSLDEAMNADSDGDGLSNIFEITFGYSPHNTHTTGAGADNALDVEGDGMGSNTEQAKGTNPLAKDNPALMLRAE